MLLSLTYISLPREMVRLRAKAKAHAMQGLVKYHGLKDWKLRIPYHDSISANLNSLYTISEVEFGDFESDTLIINGNQVKGRALARVLAVINKVRSLAEVDYKVKIVSKNSLPFGKVKGAGFSSSAGAAITASSFKALGLDKRFGWDLKLISRIARLMAGSACRSVVGKYARWYAGDSDNNSYAISFADTKNLDMVMIVVPLYYNISTEFIHKDVEKSPFFQARIKIAQERCNEVEKAIKNGDFEKVGELVEQDTMELHAITMTGEKRAIVLKPESLNVMRLVKRIREKDKIPAYYSMQTGPTVFINTLSEYKDEVEKELEKRRLKFISCRLGDEVKII